MTRTGKIARLPREVRHQLNRRLQDGEPGIRLVAWLNAEPKVQEVLATGFGGRAISEQNLSEWKQGGFQDWVRHDESCERVRHLTERAEDLEAAAEDVDISHRLASVLAAEVANVSSLLLEECTDAKERWQCLREVLSELRSLRQDDQNARRVQIQEERWHEEQEQREQQAHEGEMKKAKGRALARIWAPLSEAGLAELFGGGERGQTVASWITALEHDLPLPEIKHSSRPKPAADQPVKPAPTESDLIRPDQTGTTPVIQKNLSQTEELRSDSLPS